ncbi:NrfD protein [Salmonella enterica subsp. enterica serovar Uganda str. R8-3404]|uniref:NrfD protein n=1 Tax=Salmonella enterica subsp. enterica serovar Uganda str. R8-3404 TaxID=913083 RepID=A0A6C8H5J1_SALET|nr:NrfD protein [Salmonella enterica subsp. enterica serovar Uganda str. R8-3404]
MIGDQNVDAGARCDAGGDVINQRWDATAYQRRDDDGQAAALGGGFWSWWFWLGVVGLGLIIPLLLKPWANRSVTFHGVLAVCGASLTGVLLLRFFILYAGQLTVA